MRKTLGRLKRGLQGVRHTLTEKAPSPNHLPYKIIGKSLEGREIIAYTLGDGPRQLILVSAIHGNEVGTIKLAHFLLNWLEKNPQPSFTIHIIPCLNPDGYHQAQQDPDFWNDGRIGRLNARNVDLNRNFPTKSFKQDSNWTHGKDYQELTAVYCGESGGSEPEIQALTHYILDHKISTYFGLHSAGRDVMGNNQAPAQDLAHIFSESTGYRFSTPDEWTTLGQTGTTKEWCEEHEIAYLEIEASSRWGADWAQQKPGILACLTFLAKA